MIQSPLNVVFDLGGVVVRIAQTWQQAIESAELNSPISEKPPVPLTDFPPFNAYQANEVTLEAYISELATYLEITEEEATHVHLSILREMYPGMAQLIDGLNTRGVQTGCLSNTNAPHWLEMTETERFAPVARIHMRAGSHELGFAKPDVRAFEAYINQFGLHNQRIVYFDDAAKNVEVARQLGWDAHIVDPYGQPAVQIEEILQYNCV